MAHELGRDHLPTATRSWHAAELEALRQERDALRSALAGLTAVSHGTLSPQSLRLKRQWCTVQRIRATQQRRRKEPCS